MTRDVLLPLVSVGIDVSASETAFQGHTGKHIPTGTGITLNNRGATTARIRHLRRVKVLHSTALRSTQLSD